MKTKKLDEEKSVLLEMKSYDLDKITTFIKEMRLDEESVRFERNGTLHIAKINKIQETWENERLVYTGFVTKDLWVYEYRYNKAYMYHGGEMMIIKNLDFSKSMEALFQSKRLSLIDGIEKAFLVRACFANNKSISQILNYRDKKLFQSIISKLHNSVYSNRKSSFSRLAIDVEKRIIKHIDTIIEMLKKKPHLILYLNDISYSNYEKFI